MRAQINLILKDHETCRGTLWVLAKKVLPIKVFFQSRVIAKVLICQALCFAHVTFVVILLQVHVQVRQIIEALRAAKFAQGMSSKARLDAVSRRHVRSQLRRREAGQESDKISLVVNTEFTKSQAMLIPQMI